MDLTDLPDAFRLVACPIFGFAALLAPSAATTRRGGSGGSGSKGSPRLEISGIGCFDALGIEPSRAGQVQARCL